MRYRARDKLAEAEFFFGELTRYRDDLTKFRYCLSAFVAALRSITLVLQKDLRSKHQAAFDTWWRGEAAALGSLPYAGALVELRNVTQKQGNRLPQLRLEFADPEISGASMIARYDLATGAVAEMSFQLAGEVAPRLLPEEAEQVQSEDNLGAMLEVMKRSSPQITEWERKLLASVKPTMHLVIDDRGTLISMDDFILALRAHVDARRNIVNAAEERFPISDDEWWV